MAKFYFDLFKSLLKEKDMETLQLRFLVSLIEIQNVERGSIWIKENDHYLCTEAVGKESAKVKNFRLMPEHRSIVGWVIENQEMTIADPRFDERTYNEIEEKLDTKNTLILCFPLFHENDEIYGALEILDTSSQPDIEKIEQSHLNEIQEIVNIGSIALSNAIHYNRQKQKTEKLQHTIEKIRDTDGMIQHSATLEKIMENAANYAILEQPILITGEKGTEKGFIAEQIYKQSRRKDKPFRKINCNMIPPFLMHRELFGREIDNVQTSGLFELMNGGTLFLDNIDILPLDIQESLLEVIENKRIKARGADQEKPADIRIIAGTCADIQKIVEHKAFIRELYRRMSVLTIDIPPLRKRKEPVSSLINYFMKKHSLITDVPNRKLSKSAFDLLNSYLWPGNTKELELFSRQLLQIPTDGEYITSEDILTYSKGIDFSDSKTNGRVSAFGNASWEEIEKEYMLYNLRRHSGNITKAAKSAGINRSTFVSRMRRLNLSRTE